jgi:hypothetical protein
MKIPLVVCFDDGISENLRKNFVGKFGYVKFLSSENITFGEENLEEKNKVEEKIDGK